jgi:hypothetical protein
LKRLSVPGSAISFTVATADSGTRVLSRERTYRFCRSATLARLPRSACRSTSYSLPLSTKVVAFNDPSMVCRVPPISLTETFMSAARSRSTFTRNCGRVSL